MPPCSSGPASITFFSSYHTRPGELVLSCPEHTDLMLTRLLLLAAPAAMLVSAQVPPQSVPIPGCTTDSFAIPSWFVQDLRYSASGNASFHLLNRASNYTADVACEVGGSDWTTCYIQGKPSSNDTLLASIQVGEDSTQVLVSQTWTCNDRNGTEP